MKTGCAMGARLRAEERSGPFPLPQLPRPVCEYQAIDFSP